MIFFHLHSDKIEILSACELQSPGDAGEERKLTTTTRFLFSHLFFQFIYL